MLVAVVAVLLAMVSIQAGAALAKQLFPVVGAAGATGLRLALASLILCAIFRPWRATLTPDQQRAVLRYGVVLGFMNLVFYLAVARLPLGIVVAIEFSGPLAVAVFASRRTVDYLWAALAAGGIALFLPVPEGTPALDPLGLVCALAAGACWGLYIVFGQRLGTLAAGTATTLGMVIATALVLPLAVVEAGVQMFSAPVLPVAFAVAVLSSALPYTLEMMALRRLPAKTFGIFMSVEPALASLTGLLMLGERLTPLQMVATACVMAASAGSALSGGARHEAAEVAA
jgi:inner membrane transporter RhtA